MKTDRRNRGVTLVELIVVIAITGIIAAAVGLFIRRPVEGYADAARRAALTDEADTALRRITRDLRLALPNSVRVDPSGKFIEYIETTGGGRYRAEVDSSGGGNTLDFTTADTTFDVLDPTMPTLAAGNGIVVYNLYSTGTTSNAYFGDNRANYVSAAAPTITIASTLFPAPSPGKRFHVVSGPVTYGCTGGQLLRYSGYAYNTAQVAPPAGGVRPDRHPAARATRRRLERRADAPDSRGGLSQAERRGGLGPFEAPRRTWASSGGFQCPMLLPLSPLPSPPNRRFWPQQGRWLPGSVPISLSPAPC